MRFPARLDCSPDLLRVPESLVRSSASTLLLVDGHAYAYRSFYAIRNLTGPDGAPTNAIFGFIKSTQKIRARFQPTHMTVMWDGGLDEKRVEQLPQYKAQRPAMPEDLAKQIGEIPKWLEAAGIHSICQDGVEADDLIATATLRAEDMQVIIASPDKDFMQLVRPRVGLLNPNDKTEIIWGAAEVRNKSGVNPDQIVDWLSLVGDAVDNIPGAKQIGPKTAAALLDQFGTLENLLERLGEVKSDRQRAALLEASESLRRNQQIIRLRADLSLPIEMSAMQCRAPNVDALCKFYERNGFGSLLAEAQRMRQVDLF
ncbi:MAG: 5'-3' exonuclease [Pedosphaera sp.]|nr:5'-3' exonuclease [Pedosphaera sp.]MSU44490.1 5'-3' exonuclease [Pedosphaera sp.]